MSKNQKVPAWQMIAAAVLGCAFLMLMYVTAVLIKHPSDFQILVFRVILAIAAAGLGALIPGFVRVDIGGWVRAGGALAMFVLVLLVNPPALVKNYEDKKSATEGSDAKPAGIASWKNLREIEVETFDVPYPGLEKFWFTFKEETWSGGIAYGRYYLTNSADPGAVQYIFEEMKVDASNLPLSADISFADSKPDTLSIAGLLYRFDERTRYYYAFCIDREGRYTFYRRDERGFGPVSSGRAEGVSGKGEVRLGIIGAGDDLRLYVNDALVKVVRDDVLKTGFAGILAAGIGTFGFDNFTVYEAADPPPQ